MAKKELTAYPSYGHRDERDASWVVSLRVWVRKRRDFIADDIAVEAFERNLDAELTAEERAVLKERFADFIADDDSFERVEFQFEGDTRVYKFDGRTDFNGLVEQTFRLPAATFDALRDEGGWLTYAARSDDAETRGRVRLLEPEGLSVVSDIDDTIKVTEVPAGGETVLRRTFLMQYEAATVGGLKDGEAERQMRDLYWELYDQNARRDVSFHYVSGSPWQMFKLLDQFLVNRTQDRTREGFPEGTFHMKSVRKNLLDPDSWQDLLNFARGKKATLEQKIGQITELMVNLPRRRFILIGDSGEMDPEVFLALDRMFRDRGQVERIIIRDVLGDRLKHPKIEVLSARTVRYRTQKLLERVIAEKKLEIKLGADEEGA
jgi:phosphatidate phosphatase APP1